MEMKEIITAVEEVDECYKSNTLNTFSKKFLRNRIDYLVGLLEDRSIEMEKDTSSSIDDILDEYNEIQSLIVKLLKIKFILI